MKNFFKKISSRKFLITVAVIVIGVLAVVGVETDAVIRIIGAISSAMTAAIYIITEGKIDAANVTQIMQNVETITKEIKGIECEIRGTEGNEYDEADEMEREGK